MGLLNNNFSGEINCQSLTVFIASMLINLVSMGIPFSVGIYNVEFLNYFYSSRSSTSWISSINIAVLLGSGPIVAYLLRRFSHRAVTCTGILLSTFGLLACYFAVNIPYMCLFYGLVTGFGQSMAYFASTLLVCNYFDKYRCVMTAAITAGGSAGSLVFPACWSVLIDVYSWRGSMFIVAGLNLQVLICGFLLSEPKRYEKVLVPACANRNESAPEKDDAPEIDSNIDNSARADRSNDRVLEKLYPSSCSLPYDDMVCSTEKEFMEKPHKNLTESRSVFTVNRSQRSNDVIFEMESGRTKSLYRDAVEVITNLGLNFYFISNLSWNIGSVIVYVFVADYFVETYGQSLEKAAYSLIFIGLGSIFGAIVAGILGNIKFDVIWIYSIFCILMGGSTFLFILYLSDVVMVCVCLLFGFTFGAILGIQVIVTAQLTPRFHLLSVSFGYIMLANGIGNFIGPPIGGVLFDVSHSYTGTLCLAGTLNLLSGLVMFFLFIKRCC